MKILVTGGTGFVGRNVVKKLILCGHDVYVLVRCTTDTSNIPINASIYKYNSNPQHLIDYFKKENFCGILHLASLILVNHTEDDINNLINTNITLGTSLLEVAKQTNVKWFLNTGTFWQSYNNYDYNPVNLYAATKQAFEAIAKLYTETSDIIFVTIKLNDTFGPNDTRSKIFNIWDKSSKNNETINMSPGDQIIDISYIEDVVSAYTVMIDNLDKEDAVSHKNKTYVVSNKDKMSLKELSKVFEKSTGRTLNINWGGRDYREREVMTPYDKGENVPGWKQMYDVETAIVELLNKHK